MKKDAILIEVAKKEMQIACISKNDVLKALKKSSSYVRGFFAANGIGLSSQSIIISQISFL